jgi:hypothetical protein
MAGILVSLLSRYTVSVDETGFKHIASILDRRQRLVNPVSLHPQRFRWRLPEGDYLKLQGVCAILLELFYRQYIYGQASELHFLRATWLHLM